VAGYYARKQGQPGADPGETGRAPDSRRAFPLDVTRPRTSSPRSRAR